MTAVPETDWTRIDAVLDAVWAAEPHERSRVLRAKCAGDAALRRDVEALLAAEERSPTFLDRDALSFAGPAYAEAEDATEPEPSARPRVGPYRLVEAVGRGARSCVYRAERVDGAFEQQVAVKRLPIGLDTEEARRRFRLERQVLADLQHPNIAQLFDGNIAADGVPYLVMEYVDGLPITDYCNAHRLSVSARIDLLCIVAQALQYAHRNLVVHRDLKPSNILVDTAAEEPTVKLLDFGIAKLLSDGASGRVSRTRTGVRPMTPAYAAPEQMRGGAIRTTTDVYQLGVLAYEVLSGHRPFEQHEHLFDIEQAVCNEMPVRPSAAVAQEAGAPPSCAEFTSAASSQTVDSARQTSRARLQQELRGDLDAVLLKALRKAPEERYASVKLFMADVQRHQNNQPVQARPRTLMYRLRKFVQRHRWGVAVAVAFGVTVVLSVGLLVQQRNRAQQQAAKAERVSDFMARLFKSSSPYAPRGDTLTARALLQRGQRRLSALDDQPSVQAHMLSAMGRAHLGLGNVDAADSLLQRSSSIYHRLHEPPHEALAAALTQRAEVRHERGRYAAAESLDRAALRMRTHLHDAPHPALAESMHHLARRLVEQARYAAADSLHRAALNMRQQLFGQEHPQVAATAHDYAYLRVERGDYAAAESLYRDALSIRRRTLGAQHPATAATLEDLAMAVEWQGELAEAERLKRRVLAILRRHLGRNHPDVTAAMNDLAVVLRKRAAYAAAESLHATVLDRNRARHPRGHPRIAITLGNLAEVRQAQGRWESADSLYRRALTRLQRHFDASHPRVAAVMSDRAKLLRNRGALQEAERLFRTVLQRLRRSFGPAHPYVAITLGHLAATEGEQGEPATADSLFRHALALKKKAFAPRHPRVAATLHAMANWQRMRGELAAAERLARRALSMRRDLLGGGRPATAQSQALLARVRATQGYADAADSLLRRAHATLSRHLGPEAPATRRARRHLQRLAQAP